MEWRALDELLERVEKLEEEVYLLKPFEQEDENIPEIYITENGNSFLLKDGDEIRKISTAPAHSGATRLRDCLDGIKRTIDHIGIVDPKILWTTERTNLIILNEDVYLCLTGVREPPEQLKTKTEYIREEIRRCSFYPILNTNKLLAKKLSRL